jgi:inward rectifier potassium channel
MSTPEDQPPRTREYRRFVTRGGKAPPKPLIKGQDGSQWTDAYHLVLTASWPGFFLGLALYYASVNVLFTFLYAADMSGVQSARGFWDCFLFSVQTMSAASYTVILPRSVYVEIVMSIEAFFGIVNLAIVTGIVFARFSRPYARIVFSNVAVIVPFNGTPTLMFRAANQRANLIYDANVTVSLARQVTTTEGHVMRRFEELPLIRKRTPLFALSWTVMHRIDEASPLHGLDQDALFDMEAELIIMLSGTDETLADLIYARHSYMPEEILPDRRFIDVISVTDTGRRLVDLTRFHDTEPFQVETLETEVNEEAGAE